jgi:hypothetical protein
MRLARTLKKSVLLWFARGMATAPTPLILAFTRGKNPDGLSARTEDRAGRRGFRFLAWKMLGVLSERRTDTTWATDTWSCSS